MTTIRTAEAPDAPALARLAADTFPLACPPGLPGDAVRTFIAENLTEDAFRSHLTRPGHRVLIAEVEDRPEPTAYALLIDGAAMDPAAARHLTRRPTRGISKFYVCPAAHGTGVAAALLERLVRDARAEGIRGLWLATNVGNARARRFYERHGFSVVGTRTFVVGGVDNEDVVYELPL